jgi:hypothetical protein
LVSIGKYWQVLVIFFSVTQISKKNRLSAGFEPATFSLTYMNVKIFDHLQLFRVRLSCMELTRVTTASGTVASSFPVWKVQVTLAFLFFFEVNPFYFF